MIDVTDLDLVREWRDSGFRIELYFHHFDGKWGREYLAYRLFDQGELIFEGETYSPPPLYKSSAPRLIYDLIGFLTLREEDTDPEYFEDYTSRQLAWIHGERCEELSYIGHEMEDKDRSWVA